MKSIDALKRRNYRMKAARPPKAARPAMAVWRAPLPAEVEVAVAEETAEEAEPRRDERLAERLLNPEARDEDAL